MWNLKQHRQPAFPFVDSAKLQIINCGSRISGKQFSNNLHFSPKFSFFRSAPLLSYRGQSGQVCDLVSAMMLASIAERKQTRHLVKMVKVILVIFDFGNAVIAHYI